MKFPQNNNEQDNCFLWQALNNFERPKNYSIPLTINTTATAIDTAEARARANTCSVKCGSSHNGTLCARSPFNSDSMTFKP